MTSYQNLFIAKIPHDAGDGDLMRVFGRFNPVSAKVMLDAASGTSKGFGFVLFNTEEEGLAAHKALDRTTADVNGRTFTVNACPSKYDARVASHHSPSLYIRNIPRSHPQEEVDRLLNSFGRVVSSILRDEPNGYPVWVIYVRYERQQDADAALTALHNNHQMFPGSEVPVLAKYAKQKSQGPQGQAGHHAHAHASNSPQDGAWPTPPSTGLNPLPDNFGSGLGSPQYDSPSGSYGGMPRRRSGGSPHTTSPTMYQSHNRRFSSVSTPNLSPHQSHFAPGDVRRFSTSSFQHYASGAPMEEDSLNATRQPRKSSMDLEGLQPSNFMQPAQHVAPGNVLQSQAAPQRSPTVSPTNKQIDANGYYRHSPYGFA
eukprot:GILI01009473.1.p1 GENE.GILI01009473.1~~GILI01009473.1.p1  ORF type:complete len:371 (+),score=49.53 GILI01009473.1:43-1155(+)